MALGPTSREAWHSHAEFRDDRRSGTRPHRFSGGAAMSDAPYIPGTSDVSIVRDIDARSGLLSWLATVDHKRIGIMYLLLSLVFFAAGGIEALLMRIQLARPNLNFLSPD